MMHPAMNLFTQLDTEPTYEEVTEGAVLMRGLALPQDREFLGAVDEIVAAAPLHNATTPSGLPMSVMVTDCGDPSAFARRWDPQNPESRRWPPIPRVLREIWPWIAAFLLLLLCAEWWLFSRSYTLSRKHAPTSRRGGGGVNDGWGRLRRPLSQSPALSNLQHTLQSRYKTSMKRIAKARKRLKTRARASSSKGKRNANV